MSDQLPYITRLWWNAHYRTGVAAHRGRREPLHAAPAGLLHAIGLDYAPAVDVAQLQPKDGPMRDMTPEEIAAARAYLERIFGPGAAKTT